MAVITLSQLKKGEQGIVESIDLSQQHKRRLEELGFISGSKISVLHTAPSGSPIACYVKGTTVALRSDDCKQIHIYVD